MDLEDEIPQKSNVFAEIFAEKAAKMPNFPFLRIISPQNFKEMSIFTYNRLFSESQLHEALLFSIKPAAECRILLILPEIAEFFFFFLACARKSLAFCVLSPDFIENDADFLENLRNFRANLVVSASFAVDLQGNLRDYNEILRKVLETEEFCNVARVVVQRNEKKTRFFRENHDYDYHTMLSFTRKRENFQTNAAFFNKNPALAQKTAKIQTGFAVFSKKSAISWLNFEEIREIIAKTARFTQKNLRFFTFSRVFDKFALVFAVFAGLFCDNALILCENPCVDATLLIKYWEIDALVADFARIRDVLQSFRGIRAGFCYNFSKEARDFLSFQEKNFVFCEFDVFSQCFFENFAGFFEDVDESVQFSAFSQEISRVFAEIRYFVVFFCNEAHIFVEKSAKTADFRSFVRDFAGFAEISRANVWEIANFCEEPSILARKVAVKRLLAGENQLLEDAFLREFAQILRKSRLLRENRGIFAETATFSPKKLKFD